MSGKKPPKPVARMVSLPLTEVIEKNFGKDTPEGQSLSIALFTAIPLWQMKYKDWTENQRLEELKVIESSDFCLRMEYVLHRGSKQGDTAKAFNDLAKAVALLSFFPGGITAFGTHWGWQKVRIPL